MSDKNVTIKSRSKEQALQEAAKIFNVPVYKLGYEAKRGLFSAIFGSSEYKVWVVGRDGKKSINSRPLRPRKQNTRTRHEGATARDTSRTAVKGEMTAVEIDSLKDELADFCQGICSKLVGDVQCIQSSFDEVFGQKRLTLDVKSKELEDVIQQNSKIAESLEHILRKKPRHLKRELPFRIMVDANGIRKIHETDLQQVAGDISEKVAQNKRPIILNYKSAYDRKIIHLALDGNDLVSTRSVGNGASRRLMVVPKGYQELPKGDSLSNIEHVSP